MVSRLTRILVLCKTYPSPSSKYAETSCVAGVEEDGSLIRLYPVPFRLIDSDRQFRKWEWIEARVEASRKDHRPESHKVFVDTIHRHGPALSPKNNWHARRECLAKIPIFENFRDLDIARESQGITLGIVRPAAVLGLDITLADKPNWTEAEKAKLIQMQHQAELFDESDFKSLVTLRKLPVDFHYRYSCRDGNSLIDYRHKIVDWEAGALYWNVRRSHNDAWQKPFRQKLEVQLPNRDLMFLMGTIHRFPDQWLIVSLIYPPRQLPDPVRQGSLL